jgi:predicted phage tail protein
MTTIKFYGKLAKLFGAEHHLELSSLSEFGAAMECQCPGFRAYFASKEAIPCYAFVDGEAMETEEQVKSKESIIPELIEMVPALHGSAVTAYIVTALGYIGITGAAASMIASAIVMVGVSLITSVVMSIFAPKPKNVNAATANAGLNSYFFGGRQNRAMQGQPIPVLYGELLIGSYVIQAGIKNVDAALSNQDPSVGPEPPEPPPPGGVYRSTANNGTNPTFTARLTGPILPPYNFSPYNTYNIASSVTGLWVPNNPAHVTEHAAINIRMLVGGAAEYWVGNQKLGIRLGKSFSPVGSYLTTPLYYLRNPSTPLSVQVTWAAT